jgi:16S rRNA processing protein RimM
MQAKYIVVGRVGAPFGVKGWVHIQSFTNPSDNIIQYQKHWCFKQRKQWQAAPEILELRKHGNEYVAQFKQSLSRESAKEYTNLLIGAPREVLPELDETQYYWADLVGLKVYVDPDQYLGVVDSVLDNGSNDILDVLDDSKKEYMIPFVLDTYILEVNLEQQRILITKDAVLETDE